MIDEPDYFFGGLIKYPILIRRHPELLHLCGYVGVTPDHSLYRKDYSDDDYYIGSILECHGGITFTDHWKEWGNEYWWLGFDCGHLGDLSPGLPYSVIEGAEYRTFNYVKDQCELLSEQLRSVK
jgi:hypothetical protein